MGIEDMGKERAREILLYSYLDYFSTAYRNWNMEKEGFSS